MGYFRSITNRLSESRAQRHPITSRGSLTLSWAAALCGIAILLVIMGVLQYRWNTQIRQATEVRMGADLESAMMKWHLDLYGEFSAICVALQIGPDSGARDSWDDYLPRYVEWIRAASDPASIENLYTNRDLIEDVYIWETSSSNPRLLRFDVERGKIENSLTPQDLQPLLVHLQRHSSNLRVALRAWRSDDRTGKTDAYQAPLPQPAQRLRSTAITGWQFDDQIPAIVHPIFHHIHRRSVIGGVPASSDAVDWVVVVLKLDTIQKYTLTFTENPAGINFGR